MPAVDRGVIIRFRATDGQVFNLDLEGPEGEPTDGTFTLPYDPPTWVAALKALEPDFAFDEADPDTQSLLQPLLPLAGLPETAGRALAGALFIGDKLRQAFDAALLEAEAQRRPLPVVLQFGPQCDVLVGLPWELLHHHDRFLVADTSIVLSRCPEGGSPPPPALAELPLRLLLVLSEPLDAVPILPERAREELVHGLRRMDEEGAVIVDVLRPPTHDALLEALAPEDYHAVVFYGHGSYDPATGGRLLFEDEFGAAERIKASELGVALRNSGVRLVLLGACQSAQVGEVCGVWSGTAPALLQAGVPFVIGMQVSMRVVAARAFIRHFALSLAAGKSIAHAVGDARRPLIRKTYGQQWFVPALYGWPVGAGRLFDASAPLPQGTAGLRAEMKALRAEMATLESEIGGAGVVYEPSVLARLRTVRSTFAQKRAELARCTPGGYTPVTSVLYGVPSNPVFVGRADDVQQVSQALLKEQPVVVWGVGGIGKTALAVEVAHRQSWRFPAGVLWLDCRGGLALDTILNRAGAFCGVQGIERVEPEKKLATVRRALAGLGERCLLVLDNAEDVWSDPALREFVRQRPANCQVLLTTRDNPEQPMWSTVEVEPLANAAMTTLLLHLAAAAGVKVGGPADWDAIPRIIGWLQGHPLALTLVVPLMRKRPIHWVWQELQKQPLKGISAAFDASYRQLKDLQRMLFTRLSVFGIPFELEAAAAVLAGEEGADEALDALDGLWQHALLGFDGGHYAYHALVRQYAYARLKEREDVRRVHRLAAEYLDAKLASAGGTAEEALERVDQWEKSGVWERFARSASALVGSLDRMGYWGEIEERLEHALASVRQHEETAKLEAVLLGDLGTIAYKSARWDRAIEFYEQSLKVKEQVGDIHGMASTYGNLGSVYARKGEWDRAIEFYERSLAVTEKMGDWVTSANQYVNLAVVYLQTNRPEQAKPLLARAYLIFTKVGSPNAQSAAAALVQACGSVEAANAYLEQTQKGTES